MHLCLWPCPSPLAGRHIYWAASWLVLGAVVGCIDGLLPILAPSVWEVSFLARLLDAVFWLPPMVAVSRMVDLLEDDPPVPGVAPGASEMAYRPPDE